MFVDKVSIKLSAGRGGNGLASFRREKYVPLGGPNGGDGGRGGHIIFEGDSNKSTLLDLRFNKLIKSPAGGSGKSKKMHGADGEDHIIKVPLGTIVKDDITDVVIADILNHGQQVIIAKGGRGGKGNYHFMNSKNPAPDYSEMGEPGEEKEVTVELKILADVGLVGFPSVGKSTFLSVVSKARPEIADYHFTTISPNLGVAQTKDNRSFVIADLPGLIEGASLGKGLGHQFLRHIERCRIIIHIVDMGANDGRDPIEDFEIINSELKSYNLKLETRPQIVVANKMDLDRAKDNLSAFKKKYPDVVVYECTTIIHEGIDEILYAVADLLDVTKAVVMEEEESKGVLFKYEKEEKPFVVINRGNGLFELDGAPLIKMFKMTDVNNESALLRFANNLKKMGVAEELRNAGALPGDTVQIMSYQFEFID